VVAPHLVRPPVAAGGGRSAERESAICEAAVELLLEVGYDRMSMDAVAARAHASKATIYRRWPGKRELVVDAIRCRAPQHIEPADTGSLRGDLIAVLGTVADGIGAHELDLLAGVLRAMRNAPEIAEILRAQMLEDKRSIGRTIVARAVARGELGPDADPETLNEVAPAVMFFRVLVTGGAVDTRFLAHVADDVLVPLLIRSAGNRQEKS
jgi:AcrR family transcriptional regulator